MDKTYSAREALEKIMELTEGLDDEHNQEIYSIAVIGSDNPDNVASLWCIEDIKEVDETVTTIEAQQVIDSLKNIGADVGINWDVISDTLSNVRFDNERQKVKN